MKIKIVALSKRILVDRENYMEVTMHGELESGETAKECLIKLENEINAALGIQGTVDLYPDDRSVKRDTETPKPAPETPKPEEPAEKDELDDF